MYDTGGEAIYEDITKIDYDFEEHEIMDILPYDKYYRNMEKFHGADQYK